MSFMPGQTPPESCHPPPEPPSHSPRMARAATRRRSDSSSSPVRLLACPVAPHAYRDQGAEQVGRDGQPRALRNVVDVADDLQPHAGADHPGQQVGQALPRPLRSRRHDPRRDDGGLEQAEVILGEVEHFLQAGDVRPRPQVHAHQPQQPARRSPAGTPRPAAGAPRSRPLTARSIDTFSTRAPSGKSMPRKKMSLQALCRQVHPNLASSPPGSATTRQASGASSSVPDAERLGRLGGPRLNIHLFPPHRSDAPPDPGWPASGTPSPCTRRPARWRWRHSAPRPPAGPGRRRSPPRTAG